MLVVSFVYVGIFIVYPSGLSHCMTNYKLSFVYPETSLVYPRGLHLVYIRGFCLLYIILRFPKLSCNYGEVQFANKGIECSFKGIFFLSISLTVSNEIWWKQSHFWKSDQTERKMHHSFPCGLFRLLLRKNHVKNCTCASNARSYW